MEYQKYFIDLNQERDYQNLEKIDFFLSRLRSENLCPFAAHAILPYVFSFKKGSWFRWERSKNSVVTQCPNPDSCISFRITRDSPGSVSVKVISQKKECLAGHKVGDLFQSPQLAEEPLKCSSCHLNEISPLSISVVSHSRLCRYYKKPGQIISFGNLIPAGFCLPAYYAAYPYALSLLYDGTNFEKLGREKTAELSCLNNKDRVRIQVRTKRDILSPILNFIEKSLRWMGLPKDILDKTIKIEVVGLEGECPKNLKAGRIVNFNLYNSQELCPAVFYNLFPYLAMLSNKIFPYWTKNRRQIDIHCPDAGADIIHRISIADN